MSVIVRHEALTEKRERPWRARVVSSNPWKLNDRLNLWSLPGDFRARAPRVVYCEPLGRNSFAIGAANWLASTGRMEIASQRSPLDGPAVFEESLWDLAGEKRQQRFVELGQVGVESIVAGSPALRESHHQ